MVSRFIFNEIVDTICNDLAEEGISQREMDIFYVSILKKLKEKQIPYSPNGRIDRICESLKKDGLKEKEVRAVLKGLKAEFAGRNAFRWREY